MSLGPSAVADLKTSFTSNESLLAWDLRSEEWLSQRSGDIHLDGVGTAVAVFNQTGHILLLQRAAHDSMPNRWELPGGAVDFEDASILHGAARELLEESGLVVTHFTHVITQGPSIEPGQIFRNSRGTKTFCKFTFDAEVADTESVKIDANEHQDFIWASEEEVRHEKTTTRAIPVTTDVTRLYILEAFRLRGAGC